MPKETGLTPRSGTAGWHLMLALTALMAAGCGRGTSTAAAPLRIAAAADLQRALPRLLARFEKQTGTRTTLTLDASGRLAEQIKAGAPFDLFFAANVKFVSDLASAGLIEQESVTPYAKGSLVLCLHQGAGDQIRGLADLTRPAIKRIAIANPDYAPYGMAARQALERAGLWASLEPKIVRAGSVGQAMTYVQNGDAEAALVSHALVGPQVQAIEVDSALYDPLIQALGIVEATKQHERAAALALFVLSDEGQSILHEHGFLDPGASPELSHDAASKSPEKATH